MNKKDTTKWVSIIALIIFGALSLFLLRPILISIFLGLILAFVFFPIYRRLNLKIKSKNFSALIVTLIALLIIIVPLWIVVPLIIQQVFNIFKASQTLNIAGIAQNLFPTASESFLVQLTVAIDTIISKLSSAVLNSLTNFFLNSMTFLLNIFIAGFVFFYALRDSEKIIKLGKDFSPFEKKREKEVIKQFKDITNSLIYGQVIVGLLQGLFAGIGLYLFGVPNALILTIIATIVAIIPVIGPTLVWIPVTIYLFAIGSAPIASGYLAYNLIIVSGILDNIVRSYIVSRKSRLSPAIALVGMIGGLFIFGVAGLIIGPLILAYFIMFLQASKKEKGFKLVEKEKDHKKILSLINITGNET